MAIDVQETRELKERVVEINRVAKVVKGGRRFSFTALVVIGDEVDRVGVGYGKAREVPLAISKAVDDAKKNLFTVPKHGQTITHEVLGAYGAAKVLLRPASPGTGVIAGGGDLLADLLRLGALVAREALEADPARAGERAAGRVVDELREDAPVRAEDDEARALGRAADLAADAPVAARAGLGLGEGRHQARFPTLRRTYSFS